VDESSSSDIESEFWILSPEFDRALVDRYTAVNTVSHQLPEDFSFVV
jgi:hypothetical protein